ncbi:NUDIX domain-containing protein [Henriciella sp. AS95]|uniref:NUDIX domain-containing protein n=1 Tax=Henriciella sp. AS95 TaxID=3135782 RepID=UPI003177587B
MKGKAGKPPVSNLERTVLSDDWAVLSKYDFDIKCSDGATEHLNREIYHRGDSVAVLPYDPERKTVLLIRQFRLAAYLVDGSEALIEACAGAIENESPEASARREALEELGYKLMALEPVMEAFSSPGSMTERFFGFLANYSPADRKDAGGGRKDEGEDIEVLEMPLDEAVSLVRAGDIRDAKTIALLQALRLSQLS